jgi:hypothetical protein
VTSESAVILGACAKHFVERAVDRCADCGDVFCAECLVPPTRRRMPVRCVDCALVAAGVRAPGQRRGGMTSLSRAQKRPTSRW